MALAIFVLFSHTAHVLDRERSTPPEFDRAGKIRQGGPVAKPVPPWTPFEIDEAEGERLLARASIEGVRVPDMATPAKWCRNHAVALGFRDVTVGELVKA